MEIPEYLLANRYELLMVEGILAVLTFVMSVMGHHAAMSPFQSLLESYYDA